MGKRKRKREDKDDKIKERKHYDTFYAAVPPGLVKEKQERPEESIPDLPENQPARDFLANAPTKGLWMPLGKEVKVMKCWRCKEYGHRTGDKECSMFIGGNSQTERFRWSHEDPMHNYIKEQDKRDKEERVKQLQALLHSSSSCTESLPDENPSSLRAHTHRKRKKRKKDTDQDAKRKRTDKEKKKMTKNTSADTNVERKLSRKKGERNEDRYNHHKKKHKKLKK